MNDNCPTPKWLMDCFEDYFDPCPLNENPIIDGLKIEWGKKTYCNPPYSNPSEWVNKAIEESKKGKLIVMLLRVDSSTKWFARLVEANARFFWAGSRIKFIGKGSPNFASMLVILNNGENNE